MDPLRMMQEMERMNKNAQKKMNISIAKPMDSQPSNINPLMSSSSMTSEGLAVGLRKNSEYTAIMDPLGHNPLLAGMDGIS